MPIQTYNSSTSKLRYMNKIYMDIHSYVFPKHQALDESPGLPMELEQWLPILPKKINKYETSSEVDYILTWADLKTETSSEVDYILTWADLKTEMEWSLELRPIPSGVDAVTGVRYGRPKFSFPNSIC